MISSPVALVEGVSSVMAFWTHVPAGVTRAHYFFNRRERGRRPLFQCCILHISIMRLRSGAENANSTTAHLAIHLDRYARGLGY